MPVFENNRDLLDGFRRGDRSALAAVYQCYVDDVARLVRIGFTVTTADGPIRVTGATDVQTEHDVLQETFVKAFSPAARTGFDGLRPYRPYLMRIAQNVLIDRFRRMQRERRDALEEIDQIIDDSGADLGGSLHWRQLSACAAEFVASLDEECRRFVTLRFEDDLSQDAVASAMGASRRRIRTLEDRVCLGLEKHLRERGLWQDETASSNISVLAAARNGRGRVDAS